LFEQCPTGTAFPAISAPAIKETLPRADVAAFSIDDSATTEIDDALSVTGLGQGTVVFGIHIAAPGLAITPDSALDKLARERLSTVYMPGWKLTMLPDSVVESYTLTAGRDCPALSLYATFDETTLDLEASESRIEAVPIVANLRHDRLDEVVTEAALVGEAPADYPFAPELAFAFRLAGHLKAQREVVRGKPENFNRPDYSFKLLRADASHEPDGSETVQISTRKRGAPLDLIVSEAMILANSSWGGWLAACGVPGIYRSQASLAPGSKVRMGIKPAPHAGIGVAQYAWSTSPLRRYVDLVNQWQLIACIRHGKTAALAAPFKPRDATLFALISQFDAAYTAYNEFQGLIERFWTLRHVQQAGIEELHCTVMKDGLARADTLPLVLRAIGTESLPRGAAVRVRLTSINLLTLDVYAQLIERIEAAAADEMADDDNEGPAAGPIALAIDVADAADAAPADEAAG
jgi:exoribonuclease-2